MTTQPPSTDTNTTQENEERISLFPQYRPSERHAAQMIKYTLQAGWLTAILAAVLLWAQPDKSPPGYWVILGTALGGLMILRGALDLRAATKHRTQLATRLTASVDHWFPLLLFSAQTVYMFLLVALMWFTLPSLGVYLHPLLHVGLFSLLTLIAIRRLIAEWARHKGPSIRLPVQDGLQYTTATIVTLLVAIALTHAISPFGHPITGDNSLPIVIIWVIASLVILCCIILFVDRIFSKRRR